MFMIKNNYDAVSSWLYFISKSTKLFNKL
jgi:hypothetical protein